MSDTTIFGCGFLGNQQQFTSSEKRLATVNLKKFGDEKGDSTPAPVPEKGRRCDETQRSRKQVIYSDDYSTSE